MTTTTLYGWIPVNCMKQDDNGNKVINWMAVKFSQLNVQLFTTKKAADEAVTRYNDAADAAPRNHRIKVQTVKLNLTTPDGVYFQVYRDEGRAHVGPAKTVIGRFANFKDALTVAQEPTFRDNIEMVVPTAKPPVFDTLAEWKKAKKGGKDKVAKVYNEHLYWGNGNRVDNQGFITEALTLA